MIEKNPYENGVDIPDFVETKEEEFLFKFNIFKAKGI